MNLHRCLCATCVFMLPTNMNNLPTLCVCVCVYVPYWFLATCVFFAGKKCELFANGWHILLSSVYLCEHCMLVLCNMSCHSANRHELLARDVFVCVCVCVCVCARASTMLVLQHVTLPIDPGYLPTIDMYCGFLCIVDTCLCGLR